MKEESFLKNNAVDILDFSFGQQIPGKDQQWNRKILLLLSFIHKNRLCRSVWVDAT